MIVETNILTMWSTLHGNPFHWEGFGRIVTRDMPSIRTQGIWFAGGSVRRGLLGHAPGRDIDIFFKDEPTAFEYVQELRRRNFRTIEKTERRHKLKKGDLVVDCVFGQFFASPQALLEDFDFTCCCFATDGSTLWFDPVGLIDAERKYLRINNPAKLEYALGHAERYMREGFTAEPAVLDELLKYGKEEREEKKPAYSGRSKELPELEDEIPL